MVIRFYDRKGSLNWIRENLPDDAEIIKTDVMAIFIKISGDNPDHTIKECEKLIPIGVEVYYEV